MLALPHVGLPVTSGPGHWCTNHPSRKGLWNAGYGESLALSRVHQNVVHWQGTRWKTKQIEQIDRASMMVKIKVVYASGVYITGAIV